MFNDDCGCSCASRTSIASQTLDELDFERGIWSAAMNGEVERVESFIRRGIDPDEKDASGFTALHYASRAGHCAVCKELLAAGANVEMVTRSGKATALHRAAANGQIQVVKMLLEKGADTTKQDADGRTALHRSAINKHKKITKMLLERGPEKLATIRDNKNKIYSDYE